MISNTWIYIGKLNFILVARKLQLLPSPVFTMMHHILGSLELFYLFPKCLTAENILMPVFSD